MSTSESVRTSSASAAAPRLLHRLRRAAADRPLWMVLPAAIAVLVLIVIPTLLTVAMSLLGVDVSTLAHWVQAPFVGLQNYQTAFQAAGIFGVTALVSILLSVAFSLITTIVITPIGVIAALAVNRTFTGRAVVRAIYLIPYVIPVYVIAIFARIVFLNQYGIFDRVLAALHLASRNTYWLIGPNAFWAMIMTEIWSTWPFIYLMALAGLQSISREHYEAAAIDGAGTIGKLRAVVLPQLSGVLRLAVLMSTLFHFGNFTLAYVMFSSPPPTSVAVLPINTYFTAFTTFNYGAASAISVVTMVLLIIPVYVYIRATRISRMEETT